MAWHLTPRDDRFLPLLTSLAATGLEAMALLAELLGAEPAGRTAFAERIADAEQQADELAQRISTTLAGSFITPFDREDLLAVALTLDQCLEPIDDVAQAVVAHRLGDLPAEANDLLNAVTRMAQLTVDAMARLADPRGRRDYWIEIRRLRNQVRHTHRAAVAELYRRSGDLVTVATAREVLDLLAQGARAYQGVAAAVERVAVKGT